MASNSEINEHPGEAGIANIFIVYVIIPNENKQIKVNKYRIQYSNLFLRTSILLC